MASVQDVRWQVLGYKPTGWAFHNVHGRDERFCSYVTCRQVGKTWAAAVEIDEGMTQERDEMYGPPMVGVLSFDYKHAELSINRYITMVRKAFGEDYISVNYNKHEAHIPSTGAHLVWVSATEPDAGVGFTFSKLIVDEAQKVDDVVWEKILPCCNVRKAKIRAFGTPDITPTQTWFRGLFLRGQDPEDTNYFSYTVSWRENPWTTAEEVDEARRNESSRMFRMLYEGEWVDAEGSVFGRLDAALIEPFAFDPSRTHVMAVDLAVRDDFTVVMVAEESTRRVVHCERWHQTEPAATYDRIAEVWQRFGRPRIIGDESGMGIGMLPELRNRGMRVTGITFTAANKMPMVARLQGAIEHGRIRFPRWEPLITELQAYVYKETPSGKLGAEAAFGFHDDCVMALLLLNEGMRQSTNDNPGAYQYLSRPIKGLATAFTRF